MSIDLEQLNKEQNKPVSPTATTTTTAPKSKNNLLMGGLLLMAGMGAGVVINMATSDKNTDSEPSAQVQAEQKLPKGVKRIDVNKLPFVLPKFFKSEVLEVYKVGSIYVIGTKDENGNMVYDSLTDDGKFLMVTYIADSDTGELLFDSNGIISEQTAQAQSAPNPSAQVQSAPVQNTLQQSSYYENGFSPDFFTKDLTQAKSTSPVSTPAFGDLKVNPDLFARHVLDSVYNSMFNSDTLKGDFKDKAQNAMYVFYDPNCPHCQIEIPQLEPLKQSGYEIIYVPVAALSQAPNPITDDDFHYQLLAPHYGKQSLVESLSSKSAYQRPQDFTLTEEQKKVNESNRAIFMDIPSILNDYYTGKYGADMATKYGEIAKLAVPTVLYVDKNTGDVKFSNLKDDLVGITLTRQ